jgi:hypothetical protein
MSSLFLTESNKILVTKYFYKSYLDVLKEIYSILPCFLSSLLTHYFYLAFFAWSTIMALDLLKMFHLSTELNQVRARKNVFLLFCLSGWLAPLLLIIAMNLKNYNNTSYGYKNCFISSSVDLLGFFVVPVAITIILNIILVLLSIRLVLKIDNLNKEHIKKEDSNKTKKRFILFIKLFLITGITWISGIICASINNKNSIFWYVYITLNSSQGVFILCSYVFNINFSNFPKSSLNIKNKPFSSIFIYSTSQKR